MMFHTAGQNGGFIKAIIIIVVVLIILGYFGYSIQDILNKPLVKQNLNYAWDLSKNVWEKYLKVPIMFVWDKIIIDFGWNNLVKLFGKDESQVEPISI